MRTNLKKEIKDLYYNLKRNRFLNKLNNISGKILVESDKVIFYIDDCTLKKQTENCDQYNLELYNLPQTNSTIENKYEQLFYYYKLNKPFYYIFDGINFNKKVTLHVTECATVIFKNCTFKEPIEINKCDKVTFENNQYYCHGSYTPIKEKFFLTGQKINKIKFINEKFINKDKSPHPTPQFGINLIVNNVEINNTLIDTDRTIVVDNRVYISDRSSGISIKAKNISIINSSFNCPNIYLESENINNNDSNLTANNGIVIENKNANMLLDNIETPYLLYNREEVIRKTKAKPYILLKKLPIKRNSKNFQNTVD